MKFTDLEVPDFTSPGEDKKSDAIKFVDELMKIAGFFSKKFEVPPVDEEGDVKHYAENLQESCKNIKELLKSSTAPASESEYSNSVV